MKSIGEKIADGIQKFYTAFIRQRVLTTPEEVQANTNEKNLASAVVVGEIYNNLMSMGGFVPIIDPTTGKITGYKTTVGGADTVFPFSQMPNNIYISCTITLGAKYQATNQNLNNCLVYCNITLHNNGNGGYVCTNSNGSINFQNNNGGARISFYFYSIQITSLTWD